MEEKQFRLKAGTFDEKGKLLFKYVLIYASIILITDFTLLYFDPPKKHSPFNSILFVVISILIFCFIVVRLEMRRAKVRFNSFTVTFTPLSVRREQMNLPILEVSHHNIKKIIKLKNGNFYITSSDVLSPIVIPYQIESYKEVEQLLSEIKPFYNKRVFDLTPFYLPIQILCYLIFIAVFVSNNATIIIISGILSLVITVYSILSIYKGKNADKQTQNAGIFLCIQAIAVVIRLWWLWFKGTQL